jgi:hypothetical protein
MFEPAVPAMPKESLTPDARVPIPAGHVEALRTSLLELHQVCADALSHVSLRHLRAGDSLAEVRACRRELALLDRLLDAIGWPGEPAGEQPVVLAGPQAPLREAVWLALTHATATLDEAARLHWQGACDLDELTASLDAVSARLALLRQLEAA